MFPPCVLSESCSREEFMCDRGRCLLPVSVCDGHPNCQDQTDEANCSHKHKGESMRTKTETYSKHTWKGPRTQEWTHAYSNLFFHRMWWAEDRDLWVPVKSKPPQALSSPAGTSLTTLHCQTHSKLVITGLWNVCFSLLSCSSVSHQLCIWYISVEEGHVITLSFRNFSLETQDVCEFDYVEVHDSGDTGAGRVLGRWDLPRCSIQTQYSSCSFKDLFLVV